MRGRFGFIVGWVPSDGVGRRRKNRRGRTIKGLLDGSQNRYFDESVLEPGSAGAADRIGGHVDSAPRARIHIITGFARRAEASGADRACTDIRRNAGPAFRTRERGGGDRSEAPAADARAAATPSDHVPSVAGASRYPAITYSPKLAGGDNQVRFRGTPPEEDSAANGLNEPPFLDPPRMAKILVCVAWPYASGPRHPGHAVSTFIPADIFARYHRMKGDEVLMVGGSDMHGTPVTVRADEEGVPPNVIAERYDALHEKNIEQLGVRYDLYWNTADPHHKEWVQDIFLAMKEKGHVYEAVMASPFCTSDQRVHVDR